MDSITIEPGKPVLVTKEKLLIEEDYELEPDLSKAMVMKNMIYYSWVTIHYRPFITEKLYRFLEENVERVFAYALMLSNAEEGNYVEMIILPRAQTTWLKIDKDYGPVVSRDSVDPYDGYFQIHMWKDGYSVWFNQEQLDCYEQMNFLDDSGIVFVGDGGTKGFDNLLEKLEEHMRGKEW